MRRRITLILLFPVLTLFFIVGWILYVVGDRRMNNNVVPQRKKDAGREDSTVTATEVEMGLIEEIVEKPLDD